MSITMIWHLFSFSTARPPVYVLFVLDRKINLQLEDIFGICLRFSDSLSPLVSNTTDLDWQISQVTAVCVHMDLCCSELRPFLCNLPAALLLRWGTLLGLTMRLSSSCLLGKHHLPKFLQGFQFSFPQTPPKETDALGSRQVGICLSRGIRKGSCKLLLFTFWHKWRPPGINPGPSAVPYLIRDLGWDLMDPDEVC